MKNYSEDHEMDHESTEVHLRSQNFNRAYSPATPAPHSELQLNDHRGVEFDGPYTNPAPIQTLTIAESNRPSSVLSDRHGQLSTSTTSDMNGGETPRTFRESFTPIQSIQSTMRYDLHETPVDQAFGPYTPSSFTRPPWQTQSGQLWLTQPHITYQPRAEPPFKTNSLLLPGNNIPVFSQEGTPQWSASNSSLPSVSSQSPPPDLEDVSTLSSHQEIDSLENFRSPRGSEPNLSLNPNWDPLLVNPSELFTFMRKYIIQVGALCLKRDLFLRQHPFLERVDGLGGLGPATAIAESSHGIFNTIAQREYLALHQKEFEAEVYRNYSEMFHRDRDLASNAVIEILMEGCDGRHEIGLWIEIQRSETVKMLNVQDETLDQLGMAKYSLRIVEAVLFRVFFADGDKIGKKYREAFRSTARDTMVAYSICVLEHILSELVAGSYLPRDISMTSFMDTFDNEMFHLRLLQQRFPKEYSELQKRWNKKFFLYAYESKLKLSIPIKATDLLPPF